ncbi:vestigial like 4 like [Scleropages formosus]|uniref:Vestigial like 4 like n=1 Tax=Scleropages formosus TaxID=113540 RepID=A0A8C9SRM0_SCLFO|nr:transcription cofactor vestigial-like protein 4 [Scleropages formosus]
MAVANVHYITRMNSGFKVYILEGQPSLRTEDRHRHVTNERTRLPPVCPSKRKRSPERAAPLDPRPGKVRGPLPAPNPRERTPFRRVTCSLHRQSSLSPPQGSPTSPQYAIVTTTTRSPSQSPCHRLSSPVHSPTGQWPSPVFESPPMEEPLALIKKPRCAEAPEADAKILRKPGSQVQMRPSVITCVSRLRPADKPPEVQCRSATAVTSCLAYDQVVEEHFRRSLGVAYHKADTRHMSVSVSVDDHFAKALGEKWLQLRASSSSSYSSPSSSPCSSPGFLPTVVPSPCSPGKGAEGGAEGGVAVQTEGIVTPSSPIPSSPVK